MKKFFNSIGFKNIDKTILYNNLKNEIILNSNEKYISLNKSDLSYAEFYKSYGNSIGISIKATINSSNKVEPASFVPYAKSNIFITVNNIGIEISDDNDYYIICEDINTNNEFMFYLHNVYDYINLKKTNLDDNELINKISVSGLSTEAKIILPIKKDNNTIHLNKNFSISKNQIFHFIKNDEEELSHQSTKTEYNNILEILNKRTKQEDIFSIIDAYMIPDNNNDAFYSILGTIKNTETFKNQKSNETIHKLTIDVIGTVFDVFINKNDLTGIPLTGMRFMGKCYMQGFIC